LAIAGGDKPTLMKRTREMIADQDMDGCTKTQNHLKIFWMTYKNTTYCKKKRKPVPKSKMFFFQCKLEDFKSLSRARIPC